MPTRTSRSRSPRNGAVPTLAIRASELVGEEHDAVFAQFTNRAPAFRHGQDKAGPKMPVIRLTPRAEASDPPKTH